MDTRPQGCPNRKHVRLGLLYPPGGGEYEYYQFADACNWRIRPLVICARSYGGDDAHSVSNMFLTAALDGLISSAQSLKPLHPDSAMWACTSGSFIRGRSHAEAQAEAISRVAGCPASSTSLAFVRALCTLGLKKVAVLATYPEATARRFADFFQEFGIAVANLRSLGAPSGKHAFAIPSERLMEAACGSDHCKAEALIIADTAIASMHLLEPLEKILGKPVLSANQVTLWEGLRLGKALKPIPGYGRLFALASQTKADTPQL